MRFWDPENIRRVTAGRWLQRSAGGVPQEPTGVSTDSRSIRRGQVFIALRGERFDGHDYLGAAAEAGAAMLIVDREAAGNACAAPHADVLLVEDAYAALRRLAAAYRRTLHATVVAVTGSVGKTTTKQLIHAVLATRMTGTASPKSYNNHIGVPLTLLNAAPADRYVIVEVGTSGPGEIAALAQIVEPDVAVITHIGTAHLERLGSKAAIAAEKASLLRHLREGGLAVVNGDARELDAHLRAVGRLIRYGWGEANDLRLTACDADDAGVRFTVNGRADFALSMLGEHNAVNALAAVAVGRHLNLSDEQIAAGLRRAKPEAMRLNLKRFGAGDRRLTVIDDAYNANPDSMAAAIGVLGRLATEGGRRVAVLGDMAELGEQAAELHRELGRQLGATDIDRAVLIGPLMLYAAEALQRAWPVDRVHAIAAWSDATADEVAALIEAGDTVLIKASRAAGLERLLPAIAGRFDQAGGGAAPQPTH